MKNSESQKYTVMTSLARFYNFPLNQWYDVLDDVTV